MSYVNQAVYAISFTLSLLIDFMFGGMHISLRIILCLMLFDLIGGVIAAYLGKSPKSKTGKISSKELGKGICRKVWIIITLSAAHLSDVFLNINYFYNMVSIALISREVLSLIEKYAVIVGEPPDALKKILEVLEDKENA